MANQSKQWGLWNPVIAFRVPDGILLAALGRRELLAEAESATVAQEL